MTINNLMTIVPVGTVDPSAVMHHEAFGVLACMSALGATSNMVALWKGRYKSPKEIAEEEKEEEEETVLMK